MRRITIQSALIVSAVAVVVWPSYHTWDRRDQPLSLEDLSVIPTYVPMDPVSLNLALDAALRGTPHFQNWSRNDLADSTRLRILIFNSTDSSMLNTPAARRLGGNAVYIPSLNAIGIDYMLVHELWQRYFPDDSSWGSRAALVSWVVGHEVGHLVSGDSMAHFGDGSLLRRRSCGQAAEELAADQYYAEVMLSWDTDATLRQAELFGEILANEIQNKPTGDSRRSGPLSSLFRAGRRNCHHPEIAVRAYRLISYVADRTKDKRLNELVRQFEPLVGT